jgi:hypothetical protein
MFLLFILIQGAAGMARILRAQATFDLLATRPTVVWVISVFSILYRQKLHSHAYTHVTVCSFVSFTYYLIYLRRWIAKKIRL